MSSSISEPTSNADEDALAHVLPNDDVDTLGMQVVELEARFRALTDGLDVGVIIHGPQTEILFGNPRAEELLGATMDQLRGKSSFDPRWKALRRDGTDFPAIERPTATAFQTKMPQRGVVVGIHRPETNDRIWLLVSAIPQLNPDGSIRQVVATFTDLTSQVAAEQQIREQDAKILELSVPFIPLIDGVALMPIIGIFDRARADRVLGVALTNAANHGCRIIIFDMTGVPTIAHDSIPALKRIADACRLVGARMTITGLRSNAARLLAQYNEDLPSIQILPRLQMALSVILGARSRKVNAMPTAES